MHELESGPVGATILVVDDDETTRAWAEAHLGGKGFAIIEAANGVQALEQLAAVDPDLVLLDVEMPELDGFDTCERIRAMPGFETVPVVMITGREDEHSINRAYASGATDFVTKPVNWPLLNHRLPYLLRSGATTTALARSREMLSAAQHMAQLGSWALDQDAGTATWSDEFSRRMGYTPGEFRPSLEAVRKRVPADQRGAFDRAIARAREDGSAEEIVHDVIWPDGHLRTVRHVFKRHGRDGSAEVRGIALDVTEQLAAQQKIHRLAYVDSLTGLPNRARFHEVLETEIARAKRNNRRLATLFLDLDNFKRINDTLGHGIGDRLLEEISVRLKNTIRCYDTIAGPNPDGSMVARLGGDEFTLLLTELASRDEASRVADRILECLGEPIHLGGHDMCVTPSIGIALYPDNGLDANSLLRRADTAMYHAKNAGKNVYRFFDDSMDASMQRRLCVENELRKALVNGEISVQYQPQLDLASERIIGMEALARWNNPALGQVPPDEFIPVAEETGLIDSLGAWVMERACSDMVGWREQGLSVSRIAVNVSPVQFLQPDFCRSVRQILERTGLPANCLDVEITEGVVIRDVRRGIAVLEELKQIGVQISVDDFGTGYSSLAQMKNLPIDRLKIDQSFVRQITSSPEDAAITSAVIAMAESMSLDVVAEGVETDAQMSFLARRHCKVAQGYNVSRPMTSGVVAGFLRDHVETCAASVESGGERQTILVVDDDAISRMLVREVLDGGLFNLIEAESAEDAFTLLSLHSVDVVVADQVMPGMLGTEFLRRVRQLFPDTARVLLSGASDRDALKSAINDSAVFRFVDKTSIFDALNTVVLDALRDKARQDEAEVVVRGAEPVARAHTG